MSHSKLEAKTTRSQATPSPAADQEGLLNDLDFLREALRRFLQQFLDEETTQPYPYLVVDARYEHVCENHQVVSKGVLLGQGLGQDGYRDLLSMVVASTESEASWGELFSALIDRGLTGGAPGHF